MEFYFKISPPKYGKENTFIRFDLQIWINNLCFTIRGCRIHAGRLDPPSFRLNFQAIPTVTLPSEVAEELKKWLDNTIAIHYTSLWAPKGHPLSVVNFITPAATDARNFTQTLTSPVFRIEGNQ